MGAIILLFGNAFSAYATAYSLTGGGVNLIPVQIGYYYTGNVLSNPHLAQAMAFGMFVVLAATMVIYVPLQRRAAKWMR
jgi:putative spermidine/putrescine transport system permease protein